MVSNPQRTGRNLPDREHLELVQPESNAVVVFSDVRCPWAHVAVYRLLDALDRTGLDGEVVIDHRAFPLEELGGGDPDQMSRAAAEARRIEPGAGWSPGHARQADTAITVPASSWLALSHVQAAKASSPEASVALDRALRLAVFAEGRPIDDADTLDEIEAGVPGVDRRDLRTELDSGRPEAEVRSHTQTASTELIPASPTLVLPDGTAWSNPGVEVRAGDDGPVVVDDDRSVYDAVLDHFLAQRTYD